MRKLGIIQPGKIGDIVICLPIAKWYHDIGYEIIWPVDENIINNFIDYVDYVTFVPIKFNCEVAKQVCNYHNCNTIIDLSFTIPYANKHNSNWYLNDNDIYTFDQLKYYIANVPFEQKWKLLLNRNHIKEEALFNEVVTTKNKYILYQDRSSDMYVPKNIETKHDIISVVPKNGYSVFDWLSIIERADKFVLISSCFTNIIDQLYSDDGRDFLVIMKPGYDGKALNDGQLQGFPRLKLPWKQV